MERRHRERALLVVPLLSFLALTAPSLTAPMWRDEAATWAFSTLGYRDLVTATGHVDRVFLPYYAVVHTLRVLGLDVAGCRALSLLAGLGTILAVQLVARRLWSTTAGLLAALTLVLNPAFVVTATSLRPYALATLLTTAATWVVVRRPRHLSLRVRWWLYLASITLAAHLHLFSATVAVPHLVWLGLRVRHRVRPVAAAWVVALALTAPLALASSRQSGQVGWISTPTVESTIRQTIAATGGMTYRLGLAAPLLVALCALLGLAVAVRRRRPDPTWLVALFLWLWPVVALTAVSFVASPVAVSRYFLTTGVGAALLVGYGASVLRGVAVRRLPLGNRTTVAGLVAGALVLLAPAPLLGHSPTATLEGHPEVDRHIASLARAGDLLVVRQGYSETGYAFGFARGLHDEAFAVDATRALVTGQPQAFVREVVSAQVRDGRPEVTTRAAVARVPARVLLVAIDGEADLVGTGLTGCSQRARWSFRQTLVRELVCRPRTTTP